MLISEYKKIYQDKWLVRIHTITFFIKTNKETHGVIKTVFWI